MCTTEAWEEDSEKSTKSTCISVISSAGVSSDGLWQSQKLHVLCSSMSL